MGHSIINNWEKLRGWELQILVDKGYERAILEQARRANTQCLYQMPDGTWAATSLGIIKNGFGTKGQAQEWLDHYTGL